MQTSTVQTIIDERPGCEAQVHPADHALMQACEAVIAAPEGMEKERAFYNLLFTMGNASVLRSLKETQSA